MALLVFLLPIFFILLGFGEIFKINLHRTAALGLIDFVIMGIILVWFLFVNKSKYSLKISILLFWIIALISLIINFFEYSQNQLFVSFMYLIRFILYSSLYFLFRDIGKIFDKLIPRLMFLSGLVFLLVGIFQYLFFRNLKEFYYMGWDMHQNRLFSSFFDPNFAGAFLVLILIFTFILKDKIFPKDWKFVPFLFLALNLIAIIFTYSRGAFLMLLTSVVVYSIITKKWLITLGLIFVFIVSFIFLSTKFDLESTNLLRVTSIEKRIDSSKTAIEIWQKNPLGIGFNAYRYARIKYDFNLDKTNLISNAGAGVDNSFVFVLVTTGVIGLGVYLYLLYKIFRLGFDNMRKNKYALVLTLSLIGLVVNALTLNSLFYGYFMIWIFVLAGFTESSLRE